ncbi:MAG: hypothetical protein Q9173_002653 [Seirophora scorigena]
MSLERTQRLKRRAPPTPEPTSEEDRRSSKCGERSFLYVPQVIVGWLSAQWDTKSWTRFDVHKRQLCEASPFFEAAFTGNFREQAGSMELLGENDTVFENFIQWLYRRKMDVSWPDDKKSSTKIYQDLLNLYILADKYNIGSLMDQIMAALFHAVRHNTQNPTRCLRHPPLDVVARVYFHSARGSKLRRFVTACSSWFQDLEHYAKEGYSEALSETPEFAADLAVALASRLGGAADPFWCDGSCFLVSTNTDAQSKPNTQEKNRHQGVLEGYDSEFKFDERYPYCFALGAWRLLARRGIQGDLLTDVSPFLESTDMANPKANDN